MAAGLRRSRTSLDNTVDMKPRTIKRLAVLAVACLFYLAAYFASVRTEYLTLKSVRIAVPVYRPLNWAIIKVAFAPAHFLDSEYLRNSHWYAVNKA